jgi:hypothetical protein
MFVCVSFLLVLVTFLNKIILNNYVSFTINVLKKKKMASNETFVTCPYNEHHSVRLNRMQYHLTKCQKNYPDADFAICPFNARHHIPRINLESHIKECPHQPIIRFSNRNPHEDEKIIVYGSSFVPYECDPDFPESFSQNPMNHISKVNPRGLGRGSLLTSQDWSRKKVTFGETKFEFQQEGSSARLVGLGRAQLIRIYQENRKKSSN